MKKITVLLADDHALMREGCRKTLEGEDDLEVVGEAQNGREAVAMAKKLLPDVVLMDIAMPVLNGLVATRLICQAVPATKVVIFTAYSNDLYIQKATEFGAAGYVLKAGPGPDVCQAIRRVHQGKFFLSPGLVRHFDRLNQPGSDGPAAFNPRTARLTPRELEVLQLVVEGWANKQAAAELGVKIKTVEKHRAHIMEKLDIHHTAGLTRYAISAGIIEGGDLLGAI